MYLSVLRLAEHSKRSQRAQGERASKQTHRIIKRNIKSKLQNRQAKKEPKSRFHNLPPSEYIMARTQCRVCLLSPAVRDEIDRLHNNQVTLKQISTYLASTGHGKIHAATICRHYQAHRRIASVALVDTTADAIAPPPQKKTKTVQISEENQAISTRATLRRLVDAGIAGIQEKGEKVDASVLLRALMELQNLQGEEIHILGPWLRICEAADRLDQAQIESI